MRLSANDSIHNLGQKALCELMLALSIAPQGLRDAEVRGTNRTIIDSNMTRDEALGKNRFPASVLRRMELVRVTYHGFDGHLHVGQIVVDRSVADQVREIFGEIEATGYPIKKVVPIVAYGWNDQASIDDNNTSGFNYRHVIGPGQNTHKLSVHSFGRAIDLNPGINPFVAADGRSPRPYDPSKPGTLTLRSPVTQIFLRHGWKWGGLWHGGKDYQHFERPAVIK